MAVCLPASSFELIDCQGTVLRHVSTACIDEQTLKDLAQVLEVDKRSKLEAECPEFGMSGASAYLALAGGDYNLAREELLAVHQRFKAQTVQQVQQLEADLQDARQAKEQAELERDAAVADSDSAVAEGVRQRDEWEKESETFKAEAAMANIKLCAMEVKSKELEQEYQDVHGYIATLEHEHNGRLAECRAQVADLQGVVAELRAEAAADMGHTEEAGDVHGKLDEKQQQVEDLECRLAHSQTSVQLLRHILAGTRTELQETQHELAEGQGRLQALQHELAEGQGRLQALQHEMSHTQERLQAKVEHAWSMYNRVLTNYWEAEDKYNESEETLATLRRAVDADVAHRRKQYNDMFDTMFKQQLDLIGENELLKHEHAALEEKLEPMQRELDMSNQWRLEADEELDQVTDELTLFKETLHAQGFRLPNGDPIIVSQPPLGLEE